YWYMPIYYRSKSGDAAIPPGASLEDMVLVDGLRKHAQLDLDKKPDEQADDPKDSPWTNGAEKSP
ncbi:MAG TPA: hypothetical protein VMS17_11810, partial [Gemmataceae bacterium]|nr:hypothetical protein [Gemmataceae bacterium]